MPKKPRNPQRSLAWGMGYVQRRPNDRFQARWYDGDHWRAKTFSTLDAAEDHVREQARRYRRGGYIAPADMTVADVIEGWLERGSHDWSPNTVRPFASGPSGTRCRRSVPSGQRT